MEAIRFMKLGTLVVAWAAASCGSSNHGQGDASGRDGPVWATGGRGAPQSGGQVTATGGFISAGGSLAEAGVAVAGDAASIVTTGGNPTSSDAGLDTPVDRSPPRDAEADRDASTGHDAAQAETAMTGPERPWPCADAGVPVDLYRPSVRWTGENAPVNIGDGTATPSTGTIPPVYVFPGTTIVSHTPLFAGCPDQIIRLDSPGELTFVNLDGDGRTDFAVRRRPESLAVTNTLSFYAHGTLGTARKIGAIVLPRGDYPDAFAVSDLDGDGLGDVVLAHHRGVGYLEAELAVYHQRANGFPTEPDLVVMPSAQGSTVCTAVQAIHADDVDGDGRPDLVVLTKATPVYPADDCPRPGARVLVLKQNPTGGFAVTQALTPPNVDPNCKLCAHQVAIGDVNGDGRKDLAVQAVGSASGSSGAKGWDSLIYQQTATGFPEQPTQVLTIPQYVSQIRLADVNDDGRLDVLVRPGKVDDPGIAGAIRYGSPSLSGVYLGTSSGSFGEVRPLQVPISVPSDKVGVEPYGIDVRDVNADGARDLAVNRFNWSEAIFLRHQGAYGTTANVEAGVVLREVIALAVQNVEVTLEASPESSAIGLSGRLNRLAYFLSDVDADGREDFVAALAPFAPNASRNPQTGSYGPSATFEPNTYTDLHLHLQRAPERRFAVEIPSVQVGAGDQLLRIQLGLKNLAKTRADDVRIRILARESPMAYHLTPAMLAAEYEKYATEARATVLRQETKILGTPLGSDILIPRIEAGASLRLDVQVNVAFVNDLVGYALFAVVDPDTATNVLYRTTYDFLP